MRCPKCQLEKKVKSGIVREKQRYKCKECGTNLTFDDSYFAEKEKKRRFGLSMYLEGTGFHSIGRLLSVSHVAVQKWVKKYGAELKQIRNPKPVRVMELDELHTYVGSKKNYKWVWISVDRESRQYVDFFLGNRGKETGKRLWD